jgi:hypothetical protein
MPGFTIPHSSISLTDRESRTQGQTSERQYSDQKNLTNSLYGSQVSVPQSSSTTKTSNLYPPKYNTLSNPLSTSHGPEIDRSMPSEIASFLAEQKNTISSVRPPVIRTGASIVTSSAIGNFLEDSARASHKSEVVDLDDEMQSYNKALIDRIVKTADTPQENKIPKQQQQQQQEVLKHVPQQQLFKQAQQ